MAKVYDNATDIITFARGSSGTALRRVGYGENLVTNDDFSLGDNGDWNTATGWTISGGVATLDGSQVSTSDLSQVLTLKANTIYQISLDVTNVTTALDLVTITNTGGPELQDLSGTGTYTAVFVAPSTSEQLIIRGTSSSVATIDNISVKEVFFDRPTDDLVLFNHPDDIPRIEYGSDGSLKGLLIEEQRTNYLLQSENLLDAAWGGDATVTDNGDGSFNVAFADAVVQDIRQTNAGATGSVNTASVEVKKDNVSDFDIYVDGGAPEGRIRYNFDTDTFSLVGSIITDYGSVDLGGGWVRVWVTADGTGSGNFRLASSGLASGEERIHVRRPQHEEGSFATSYIPTSGSQSTRSADVASIPVSAFGHNPDAGTIVVEFDYQFADGESGFPRPFEYGNSGTQVNRIAVYTAESSGNLSYNVLSNNVGSSRVLSSGTVSPVSGVAALAFRDGDIAGCLDGGSVVTSSDSVSSPSSPRDILKIGGQGSNTSSNISGHIKSIQYYPRRLTDAQLQELTS